jgi:hypothetical protein
MNLKLKKVKEYDNGITLFKTPRGVRWYSYDDEYNHETLYISDGMVEEFDIEAIQEEYRYIMSSVRVMVLDIMEEDAEEFGGRPGSSVGFAVMGSPARSS